MWLVYHQIVLRWGGTCKGYWLMHSCARAICSSRDSSRRGLVVLIFKPILLNVFRTTFQTFHKNKRAYSPYPRTCFFTSCSCRSLPIAMPLSSSSASPASPQEFALKPSTWERGRGSAGGKENVKDRRRIGLNKKISWCTIAQNGILHCVLRWWIWHEKLFYWEQFTRNPLRQSDCCASCEIPTIHSISVSHKKKGWRWRIAKILTKHFVEHAIHKIFSWYKFMDIALVTYVVLLFESFSCARHLASYECARITICATTLN